jgi:hypothetical protein
MHQSIDKKFKLFFYLILFIFLSTQIAKNNSIGQKYTNVSNIEIKGLSKENNLKVYESLKFLLAKSVFFY